MVYNTKGDRAVFGIVVLLLQAALIGIYAGTSWYSTEFDGGALYNYVTIAGNYSPPSSYVLANPFYGPQCYDVADSQMCSDQYNLNYDSMFQDVHIMIFIGFGFLMTFLKKYAFTAVSANMLVAAFSCEWGALLYGYLFQFNYSNNRAMLDFMTLINADFTAGTVLISMGAVLGKTSPLQLIIMALIECVLSTVNLYIGESLLEANDPGGSMAIHTFGAYFGLSVSTVLSLGNRVPHTTKEESSYSNDVFSMVGTVFLWICWPSFNGAIVHGNSRSRAIMNTYLSLMGSTLVTFALSSLFNLDEKDEKKRGRIEMVHVQNASLAGGVAMGTACNLMVTPWAALLIGSLAGAISMVGFKYMMPALRKAGIHDSCGVNNLHGMPGFLGGLAGVLFAGISTPQQYGYSLYTIFPAMAPAYNTTLYANIYALNPSIHAGLGRTNNMQAAYQMAALAVTMAIAIAGGWVTGVILRIPRIWGNVKEEEEYFADDVHFTVPEDYETLEHEPHHEQRFRESTFINMSSTITSPPNGRKNEVDLNGNESSTKF